jgi:DeoR family transcriptional regulator, carbon catabolite repression regulator
MQTMIKEERYKYILSSLTENGNVTYHDLAIALNVSADTIRRDIDVLHQNGLLLKVKHGAIPPEKNPFSFQDRTDYASSEKKIIALKTQQLLKKGMTLFMDGGTTVCTVAEHFAADASFRVITNNMALVPILSKYKHIELIILGGVYNKDTQTNVGAKTCADAEQFVADIYLMGTCAISKDFGITAAVMEDGAVKRSFLKGAKKVVVLSNSSKIGAQEYFKVCDLDSVQVLISELSSDDPKLDEIRFINLKIV